MKHLQEYILESLSNETSKNLNELRSWLKSKNYEAYLDTLNIMLKDPKVKGLLIDGFGKDLGDIDFKYEPKDIAAKDLQPIQKEIDLDKSVKHILTKEKNVENVLNEPVVVDNMPIVTFNDKYIIDGHHRWIEVAMMHPESKLLCYNYTSDISVSEMLKAVQGSIAAVMAEHDKEKIPSETVNGNNIYAMSDESIATYINHTVTQCVLNKMIEVNIDKDVDGQEAGVDYLIKRLKDIKNNYKPVFAHEREDMPQLTKAGANSEHSKETSNPTNVGSALNKLANGKVDKEVVK